MSRELYDLIQSDRDAAAAYRLGDDGGVVDAMNASTDEPLEPALDARLDSEQVTRAKLRMLDATISSAEEDARIAANKLPRSRSLDHLDRQFTLADVAAARANEPGR